MKLPRFMLAAPASGSGKTLITCGLLQAFVNRKLRTASFKCGPDYIDPMFHSKVIGTKSRNLDSFLSKPEIVRYLLAENGKDSDIAVLEGVMGYYDGLAGTSTKASAYEIAVITDTPTVLIVNTKGMSLSAAALIQGFLQFRQDSHICGVILNQISPMLYPRMKEEIEKETGLHVYGYVPKLDDCVLESRHLGLVMPEEVKDLKQKVGNLAEVMEKSVEIDALLALADGAPDVSDSAEKTERKTESLKEKYGKYHIRIGVARDEAFCFFYEDNLTLLRKAGVELLEFSPLKDRHLPEGIHGLMLNGGYPELYAKELSENVIMRQEIFEKIQQGMPVLAECGGFLYLQKRLQSKVDGTYYPMVGVFCGDGFDTGKLSRFGYINLSGETAFGEEIGKFPAHEFHHYDSNDNGDCFLAEKLLGKRKWNCIHATPNVLAGFPHMYFYGNFKLVEAYLGACVKY